MSIRKMCAAFLAAAAIASAVPALANPGDVVQGSVFIMRINVPLGKLTVEKRAEIVQQRLIPIISIPHLTSSMVHEKKDGHDIAIYVGKHLLITCTPADGKANGVSAKKQADMWVASLKKTLPELTPTYTPPSGN